MLYLLNQSLFMNQNYRSCFRLLSQGDSILLYEDAVLVVQKGNYLEPFLEEILQNNSIYALEEDLLARGIDQRISGIRVICYADWIDLLEENTAFPCK